MPRNTADCPESPEIVLASGSRHRARQLERLGLPFQVCATDIDETPEAGESVRDLVLRLGLAKAEAACQHMPGHLVIASDQSAVVEIEGEIHRLGKPGTADRAVEQLQRLSGQEVAFMTSLVVLDERSGRERRVLSDVDVTRVRLRRLDEAEIARYVARDDVLDCAGAFRVESLGIALFEQILSEDPTALVGLPLIRMCERLRECGVAVP